MYRAVAEATGGMLCAAQAGDWDGLVELETQRAVHVRRLEQGDNAAVLAHAADARKAEIIHAILHSERAVRALAAVRMAELSAMISSTSTERKLSQAYDAPSF